MSDPLSLQQAAKRLGISEQELTTRIKENQAKVDRIRKHQKITELKQHTSTKKSRAYILKEQKGQCALCKADLPRGTRAVLDKKTMAVICNRCLMYVTQWRRARAQGITEEATVKFDAKEIG